jgi:hypothetical protein
MRHPVVMNIGLRGPISLALKKPVAAYIAGLTGF